MYGLYQSGRCRKVVLSGGSTLRNRRFQKLTRRKRNWEWKNEQMEACLARSLFCSLFRSPPGKGKETAATQA